MARSKALSKVTFKYKSIESPDSDYKSSSSITSDKFVQSKTQIIFELLIMMPMMTKVSLCQMEI